MPLPKGTTDAPRFGLFTFTILSKLAENPNVTYRQLGQAVLQQYSADSRTAADAAVRGRTRRARLRHRQDRRGHAVADRHQGRRGDDRRRPAASPRRPAASSPSCRRRCRRLSEAVGYLEVQSAKNLESRVKPVAFDRQAGTEAGRHSRQRLCAGGGDRRRLQAHGRAAGRDRRDWRRKWRWSIRFSTNWPRPRRRGFNIELVDPGTERRAALRGDARERHCRRGQGRDRQAGAVVPAGIGRRDPEGRQQAAAGHHPSRMIARSWSTRRPGICAPSSARPACRGWRPPPTTSPRRSTSSSRSSAATRTRSSRLQASAVPRVSPGDEVHVLAKNSSDQLVDINVLYVGSDYSITHIVAERLAPQANARGRAARLHRHQLRHGADDRGADRGAAAEREGGSELPGAGRRRRR